MQRLLQASEKKRSLLKGELHEMRAEIKFLEEVVEGSGRTTGMAEAVMRLVRGTSSRGRRARSVTRAG